MQKAPVRIRHADRAERTCKDVLAGPAVARAGESMGEWSDGKAHYSGYRTIRQVNRFK